MSQLRQCRSFAFGCLVTLTIAFGVLAEPAASSEVPPSIHAFLSQHCMDCHGDGTDEGGLDLSTVKFQLEDAATFAKWERIFDRVSESEMPPPDAEQPSDAERESFTESLKQPLVHAHAAKKGTVLRRLNRREYQNTLNDLFGTNLDLLRMLPEDGRSHEFDNVGDALGLSMVHLQRYLDAINLVLETAIADSTEAPEPIQITTSYSETREAEQFIGKKWKKLDDGAVVRFSGGGYPTGMIRGTSVREPGRYRVRVRGYAYQSDVPVTFSVGGTSFARGSEKPIYGFWSFPPEELSSIEFETWIQERYMISIEPHGINDPDRYRRETIEDYGGPGLAILDVSLEGPLTDQWPSRGHQLVLEGIDRREKPPRNPADKRKSWYKPTFEIVTEDETADATRIVARVAEAAFRRPVAGNELDAYVDLFSQQRKEGSTFEEAIRTSVAAIFCSPKFLYLAESGGQLNGHELASRLSYFLTRTYPDETLLRLARSGELQTSKALREQTERLLLDARLERFLVDFTDNWLDLRDIDFTIPDGQLFPEYDSFLRHSMPLETRRFLRELIESNLPVVHLVKSDFAILNSRLAQHYDLPAVAGAELRRVRLPAESVRGGLLTQASVMKVTANGTNTSPVTRGAWVMERILGSPPPPPPPGIAGVEPDIRGAETLRDLLEKHRNMESCNACHQKIDPPGFALESFDPIGGFRDRYRSIGGGERVELQINGRNVRYRLGPEVDSSGELPGAGEFRNYAEFRDLLADDQRRLAKTLVQKLLTFATGRELGFSDREEVDRIVNELQSKGFGVRDLIHLVVQSEIFRKR